MSAPPEFESFSSDNPTGAGIGAPEPAGQAADARPECMVRLGLLPPYSSEDVHKAYKAKALAAHPDRGGSQADFLRLQEAYEQAQEYVRFREGRRNWMANQVEPYLQQQEIIQEVERRRGRVTVEVVDWMHNSFGDFATLADKLRSIDLAEGDDADGFLEFLAGKGAQLRHLTKIDLSGSRLTDAGLKRLKHLPALHVVNLARTAITAAGLEQVLGELQDLERVIVAGTSIGWWSRWKLQRAFRGVQFLTQPG